ncbi:MAG TPA: hypothetical protein VH478_13000 [Trebonia sp.]|nr:hypothetical protein [Trebonia sp.]
MPAFGAAGVPGCLPPALVDCLLDDALEPALDAAVERGQRAAAARGAREATEVAQALLAVTVCDPACGSGELLLAAAGRIARRVARARAGDQSPGDLPRALHEVVGTCVYGVDASGEAVRRARDALRAAAGVPGMAPPFLDPRIRPGNALIGASPELIEGGVPDGAFRPADGDDRGYARALRRANGKPTPGQATLFSGHGGYAHANQGLARSLAKITAAPAGDRAAAGYQEWRESAAFRTRRLVADAWCAAFAWAKAPAGPPAIVNRVLLDLRERGAEGAVAGTLAEIGRLRDEHGYFHWHLEFPGVFPVRAGEARWRGGFSCVLSVPPPAKVDRHRDGAAFGFATRSGAYPACTAGLAEPGASALRADLLFAERATAILAPGGRGGCAVAPGTGSAPGARPLLGGLLRRGELVSLHDFAGPARVGLLTIAGRAASDRAAASEAGSNAPRSGSADSGSADSGSAARDGAARDGAPGAGAPDGGTRRERGARFAFGLDGPADLAGEGRSFTLAPGEAALINPNTGALPAFRHARDAAIVTAAYRRVPALVDETRADGNPWKMRLATAFPRAAADAGLLRAEPELLADGWQRSGPVFTRDGRRMLPVYESPMVDVFDHQAGGPRYWIAEDGPVAVTRKGEAAQRPGVSGRLAELGWKWRWLCAWGAPGRDRAAVALIVPRAATADSLPLMLPRVVPPFAAALVAAQSSLAFEYVARQKADGPVVRAAYWKQLPVPSPDMLEPHLPFIVPRVLELVYTSPDLGPFAADLDDAGEPFAWDPDRRASLRADLDALFFHLYGIDARADAEYVIDAVGAGAGDPGQGEAPGRDLQRARKLALAAYDRMAEATAAGAEYETRAYPPPGHGPRQPPPPPAAPEQAGEDGPLA